MSKLAVFGIYGKSDTGKTTLITHLVAQLTSEGFKVATIKQTKKAISMDTVNKDTWRHHEAGANLVVFSSLRETNFLLDKTMSVPEIIRRISMFGRYDLLLIEGADDPSIPKIHVGAGEKRSNTIASYKGNIREVLTLIKKQVKEKPPSQNLSIMVNGKNIPLTEFPEKIITHTIIGMLDSLKGVSDIDEVTIELKR